MRLTADVKQFSELASKLRDFRQADIEIKLRRLADLPISFSFDPRGTPLYSIEETRRSYARRFLEIAASAKSLVGQDQIAAGAILARSIIETTGVACLFVAEMERLIVAGDPQKFDEKINRFLIGSSVGEIKPVHVNDALKHLAKLDQNYTEYLWKNYPVFEAFLQTLSDQNQNDIDLNYLLAEISITKNYDILSDVAHPNGPGTFFLFGQPENADENIERFNEFLKHLVHTAMWHGRHMVQALETSQDIAVRYAHRFMKP